MGSTTTSTGAGLEGVIAGESEICFIDGYAGILSYRGYNIHTLAQHATFEEVISPGLGDLVPTINFDIHKATSSRSRGSRRGSHT